MSTGSKSQLSPKESLPLLQFSEIPTVIISDKVCSQINYLHRRIGNKEWSGILLYSHKEGSIEDPENLVILIEEIYMMDIGTSSGTEYENDVDSILDLVDNYPRYEEGELKMGHIHTHHNMKCYFSAVDMDELQINSKAHNYYLSLIVNYSWDPQCKIATVTRMAPRKVSHKGASGDVERELPEQKMLGIYDCVVTEELSQRFSDRFSQVVKELKQQKKKEEEERKARAKKFSGGYLDNQRHLGFPGYYQGRSDYSQTPDEPDFSENQIDTFIFKWLNLNRNLIGNSVEDAVASIEVASDNFAEDEKEMYLDQLEMEYEEFAIDIVGGSLYLTDDEYLKLTNIIIQKLEPWESNAMMKKVIKFLRQYKDDLTEIIEEDQKVIETETHKVK